MMGAMDYTPLPIPCDLCIAAVEEALKILGMPQVSSDLHVSRHLRTCGFEILMALPPEWYVNRLKVEKYGPMDRYEWFIECGDGRAVGSNPAS